MFDNSINETLVDLICYRLNQRQINDVPFRNYILDNGLLNIRPDFILLTKVEQIEVFNYFWVNILVTNFNNVDTQEIRRLLFVETDLSFYIETFIDSIYPRLLTCGVIKNG